MQTSFIVLGLAGITTGIVVLVVLQRRRLAAEAQTSGAQGEIQRLVDTKSTPTHKKEAPRTKHAPSPPAAPGLASNIAEIAGNLLVQDNEVIGAIALAGQAADFANVGVKRNTEDIFAKAGMKKQLDVFDKRQNGYDNVDKKIDDALVKGSDAIFDGVPPVLKGFGRGIAGGIGDVIKAPIEVSKLLDSAVSGQIAQFQHGDIVDKAIIIAKGPLLAVDGIVNNVLFDGIGGGIANLIAKTPKQRAEAQKVLDLLNPSKEFDRFTNFIHNRIEKARAAKAAKAAQVKAAADKALADRLQAAKNARNMTARADALRERVARDNAAKAQADKEKAAKAHADKAKAEKAKAEAAAKEKAARDKAAKAAKARR